MKDQQLAAQTDDRWAAQKAPWQADMKAAVMDAPTADMSALQLAESMAVLTAAQKADHLDGMMAAQMAGTKADTKAE